MEHLPYKGSVRVSGFPRVPMDCIPYVCVVALLVEVLESDKERYGSPRVTREVRQHGVGCGENRVARLMREN
jgi:hypothetical protein